jgi:membrane associated rhomboid family serine protease
MQTDGGHFAGHDPTHEGMRAPAALGIAGFILLAALVQLYAGEGFSSVCFATPSAPAKAGRALAEQCTLGWGQVREGEWWRLILYCAVHHSVWHAVLCALGIYATGRAVEPIIGPAPTVCAALLGVFAGGLTGCGLAVAADLSTSPAVSGSGFPAPGAGLEGAPVEGALPLLATLAGVYSTILPGWRVGAASRWRIRFPLTAGAFGWMVAVCCAFWWATGWFPEAGPIPMLGGLATGWLFARALGFGGPLLRKRVVPGGAPRTRRVEDMDWEEFLRTELNPVLEKISTRGIHSLTRAEWKILQQSRRKLEGW